MADKKDDSFVLEIEGKEIKFHTSSRDISTMVNALTQKNKVAPGYNLLTSTVDESCLNDLKSIICSEDNLPKPTVVASVLEAVMEQVEPEVVISVKKPKK